MQKGLKKGVNRERPVVNKASKDLQENRRTDQISNSSESPRYIWKFSLLLVASVPVCLQLSLLL